MRPLRRYIDKIKPNFSKDGKFEKLESTFNAFETFLFVPDKVTTEGSHIRDALDMKRAMALVVLALIPALLFGMWNTGYQHFLATGTDTSFWKILWFGFLKVFPIVVVSYVTGLGLEFTIAQIRGHEVNEGFLVTGMLIPLILPADIPLWMVVRINCICRYFRKGDLRGYRNEYLESCSCCKGISFLCLPVRNVRR